MHYGSLLAWGSEPPALQGPSDHLRGQLPSGQRCQLSAWHEVPEAFHTLPERGLPCAVPVRKMNLLSGRELSCKKIFLKLSLFA